MSTCMSVGVIFQSSFCLLPGRLAVVLLPHLLISLFHIFKMINPYCQDEAELSPFWVFFCFFFHILAFGEVSRLLEEQLLID